VALGNPVDLAGLNARLGDAAVTLRQAADISKEVAAYIIKVGSTNLQAPPYSLSSADAASMITLAGYLSTLSGVYFGTATQGSTFSFDDALTLARGINP
jgi:hypothetical protein